MVLLLIYCSPPPTTAIHKLGTPPPLPPIGVYVLQKIVRELNHPNICGYRGVCVAAPHLSLVFEFLDNGTLGDRLRNRRPQTIATPRSNLVSPASIGVDVGVSAGVDGSSTSSVNGGSAHHGNTCTSEQILKSCNGAGGCAGAGPCDAGAAVGGVGCALADAAQGPPPPPQQLQPADIFRIVEDVVAGMLYLHEVRNKPNNCVLRIAAPFLRCFTSPYSRARFVVAFFLFVVVFFLFVVAFFLFVVVFFLFVVAFFLFVVAFFLFVVAFFLFVVVFVVLLLFTFLFVVVFVVLLLFTLFCWFITYNRGVVLFCFLFMLLFFVSLEVLRVFSAHGRRRISKQTRRGCGLPLLAFAIRSRLTAAV